jgi:hypothetical protein
METYEGVMTIKGGAVNLRCGRLRQLRYIALNLQTWLLVWDGLVLREQFYPRGNWHEL